MATPTIAVLPPNHNNNKATNTANSPNTTLPIYDAFLDLPHPCASSTVNERRIIIAPPPGEAFTASKDVGMELATNEGIARISNFWFPEYRAESSSNASANTVVPNSANTVVPNNPSAPLNRFDIHLQDFYYSNRSSPGPSFHSFAMQLACGQRVYGHVRKYFPHHIHAKSRIDVGRRGVRAAVLLTRHPDGETFYHSLLKLMESIASHEAIVLDDDSESKQSSQLPQQQTFLHFLHQQHSQRSKAMVHQLHSSLGQNNNTTNNQGGGGEMLSPSSSTLSIQEIELASHVFQKVDYSNLTIPPVLLLPHDSSQVTTSPIVPLLRCVGIAHTLRLLSALLCERRIILVSQSPSRLSACATAATSMLAQGLLHWQHIYIPILPPSMMNYLAAPMPYLIGILLGNHNAGDIGKIHGLGEVLVVLLDQNEFQTHNMPRPEEAIPDMLMSRMDTTEERQYATVADMLKLDLINVMKTDRRVMKGSESSGTAAVAGKGKDLLKRGIGKIGKVVKKQMDKQKSKNQMIDQGVLEDDDGGEGDSEPFFNESYAYTEGYDNVTAEEETRVAFTTFFLCLIGDMKWYLRPPQGGGKPTFDKELFMESKVRMGDHQRSPLYPLLLHFKESQIFEQHANARVAEIQARKSSTVYSSLFAKVQGYHNARRLDFSGPSVRNSSHQLSHQTPMRNYIQSASSIRGRAMHLTSNNRNEAQASLEMSRIVQDCRESASLLIEVMSVIWERLSDCRGMQWKHGLYALQLLMDLILHGPISAVTEATDGLSRLRQLKYYENMRPLIAQNIRNTANSIHILLINRAQLFNMRRVCALRRMEAGKSSRKVLSRNRNLHIRMSFAAAHKLVKPNGMTESPSGTVMSPMASPTRRQREPPLRSVPLQQHHQQQQHHHHQQQVDLLDFLSSESSVSQQNPPTASFQAISPNQPPIQAQQQQYQQQYSPAIPIQPQYQQQQYASVPLQQQQQHQQHQQQQQRPNPPMAVPQYQQYPTTGNQVPLQNTTQYNPQPVNAPISYPQQTHYPSQPRPTYAQLPPQGPSVPVPSPRQQNTNTQTASSSVTSKPNKFDPLNFDPFS
jgi:hypothetical protein